MFVNCSPQFFKKCRVVGPFSHNVAHPYSSFIYYFYIYIHLPALQKSVGGAMVRTSNYHNLLPKMPRYCCPIKSFLF